MSSRISQFTADLAAARERYNEIIAASEAASDRGGRGPSPVEIAHAREMFEHYARRLDLARDEARRPLISAMGGTR